jgi:hypothetical protein
MAILGRRENGVFEQPPETLDVVGMMRLAMPIVVVGILLEAVLHLPVREPVASQ